MSALLTQLPWTHHLLILGQAINNRWTSRELERQLATHAYRSIDHKDCAGAFERRPIMKQTGHRSVSVVRRYIRDAELFDDNAAAGIEL